MTTEDQVTANAARVAELEKQYGRITHVTLKSGRLLAFRSPTLEEWEDAVEAQQNGKPRGPVRREIAQKTWLPGDGEGVGDLRQVFDAIPALPNSLWNALAILAGAELEFVVKKE